MNQYYGSFEYTFTIEEKNFVKRRKKCWRRRNSVCFRSMRWLKNDLYEQRKSPRKRLSSGESFQLLERLSTLVCWIYMLSGRRVNYKKHLKQTTRVWLVTQMTGPKIGRARSQKKKIFSWSQSSSSELHEWTLSEDHDQKEVTDDRSNSRSEGSVDTNRKTNESPNFCFAMKYRSRLLTELTYWRWIYEATDWRCCVKSRTRRYIPWTVWTITKWRSRLWCKTFMDHTFPAPQHCGSLDHSFHYVPRYLHMSEHSDNDS